MILDVELKTEIRRLRKVAQRVVDLNLSAFDLNVATAPHDELLDLKRAAQYALDGVKEKLGQRYKPMREVQPMAVKTLKAQAHKRNDAVNLELLAINNERGDLSFEKIAAELDARGNVKPPRGIEWNPSSVRYIVLTWGSRRDEAEALCELASVGRGGDPV